MAKEKAKTRKAKNPKRNSLTGKIVSLTVFLDALFLVLILATSVFFFYWNFNQERFDTASFQNQVINERYNEVFDDIESDVHKLAMDTSIIDYLNYINLGNDPNITDINDPNYDIYSEYLSKAGYVMNYQEDELFDLVYVATSTSCSVGSDGCGVTYTGELSSSSWNLTERPWYVQLGSDDSVLTSVYVDELTGENVISYVERVYDGDEAIGYVGIDTRLTTIQALFTSIYQDLIGGSSEIIVLSNITTDPSIIYFSYENGSQYYLQDSNDFVSIDNALGYGESGMTLLLSRFTTVDAINLNVFGNRFIVTYSDPNETGFTIITLFYVDLLLNMEIVFIILLGAAAIMILLIGMLMNKSVKKSLAPIDDILESIDEIKNGNYDVHIKIKENNELKQIGHAINIMSEEINNQIKKTYDTLAYDVLTGLKNRASASSDVDETIFRADNRAAVCLIQVDNLKNINVTKGQIIGDNLIKAIANELKKVFRSDETLFSNGGNEFVYIKDNIKSLEEVEFALNRLLTHFKEPLVVKNIKTEVKLHVGVSVYPSDGTTLDDLIKKCDTALFKAAEEGYKKIIFYNEKIARSVSYQAEISEQLSQAIIKNQIYLRYQPLVTNTNEIYGFEALARWSSPTLGEIGPQVFIANAEESYLIIPIGTWILKQACAAQVEMRKKYNKEYVISVNVSPVQILQKDFVSIVKNIVRDTDINPEFLTLEITESLFIEASVLLEDTIEELHKIGIKLSLDDFGTGYASLTYLRQINFDNLKIDKTFVDGIFANTKDHRIIGTIVNLVHNLDMKVIAEGVETKKQYEYLKEISTDVFQGYIFSKPLLLDEAFRFIDQFYKIPKTKRADVFASLYE